MRRVTILCILMLVLTGCVSSAPLVNAETTDGNVNYTSMYSWLPWKFYYGHDTIGAFVKEVKFKISSSWYWNFEIVNVAFVEIDGNSCGLYNEFDSPSLYEDPGEEYLTLTYSVEDPCAYADSVDVEFLFTIDGEFEITITTDAASGYDDGYIRHYVGYDTQISSSSSADTSNYPYLFPGTSSVGTTPYDYSKVKWELRTSLENSGDYNNEEFILVCSDATPGLCAVILPDDDATQSDDIYWEAWINKCTDCNIDDSSQYTNGPFSYETDQEVSGYNPYITTRSYHPYAYGYHQSVHKVFI